MADTKNIKSKFSLHFEAPGADKTAKKVKEVADNLDRLSGSKGKKAADPSAISAITHRNLKQMATMGQQISTATKALTSLAKVASQLTTTLARARSGDGGGQGKGGGPGSTGRGEGRGGPTMRAPNFTRGVLQGVGLGDFYPQNSRMGMLRQAAGNVVGRSVRSLGGGLASMPFSGMSGLQTAAMGIPVAGGVLAGALQGGQVAAGKALALQQTHVGLGGFLGGRDFRIMRDRARAGEAARQQVLRRGVPQEYDYPSPQFESARSEGPSTVVYDPKTGQVSTRAIYQQTRGVSLSDLRRADETAIGRRRERSNRSARRALEAEADQAAMRASAAVGQDSLSRLQGLGARFGLAPQDAAGFGRQLLERGGGTLGGALKSDAVRRSLQLQTVFGTGPETSGAFIQGQRRGGIIGADKGAGAAMAAAVREGLRSGMDRTEVRDLLAQIAQGQAEFLRNGIPVAPESLLGFARAASTSGMGIGRGINVARGLTSSIQNIGMQGPKSATDFLMLQQFGGFKGGGLGGLLGAMEKMQNLQGMQPRDFHRFIGSISAGSGGGDAGILAIMNALGEKGAPVGVGEARRLQAASTQDFNRLSKADLDLMAKQQNMGKPKTLSQMSNQVMGLGGGLVRQAGVEGILTAAGQKILPVVQNLEESQANTVKALSEIAPTLKALTDTAVSISRQLPGLMRDLQRALSKMGIGVTLEGGGGVGE